MEVSPKGPRSHCQCQVCKHLPAQAIKLPTGAGGWDQLVEGSVGRGGRCLHLGGVGKCADGGKPAGTKNARV